MKKLALLLVAVSSFIFSPTIAVAYYVDGNTLLEYCTETIKSFDSQGQGNLCQSCSCTGYINASFDMHEFMTIATGEPQTICMEQENIKNSQRIRIIVKHLRKYPENLHYSGSYLIWGALVEAFPCK